MSFATSNPQSPETSIFSTELFRVVLTVAVPVTLQTILFSSKGLVDLAMIAQLTENNVAAMGVASRALFVAIILLSGMTTGGAILAAQYHGANDQPGIRRTTALTWLLTTFSALVPLLLFHSFGDAIMRLSTDSPEIIDLGHDYLKTAGWSLIAMAFTGSVAASMRAIRQANISTLFSGFGIVTNVFFNWVMIFGHFGFPALGLKGAAIATVVSSVLEVLVIVSYLGLKKHSLSFGLSELKASLRRDFVRQLLTLSFPTTLNFLLWAGGLFTYTALMGKAGDAGLTALSVITPIEGVSLSFLTGIANACAVLVGNHLGAKNSQLAYAHAKGFLIIAICVTVVTAVVLWFLKFPILDQFSSLTQDTRDMAEQFYLILCFGILLRSLPTLMVVGVLRAGGDVKFCLYQDLCTQWLFGIPLVALGVFIFHLSAPIIFAMFFLETLFKWVACLYRFRSRKWLKNLTT